MVAFVFIVIICCIEQLPVSPLVWELRVSIKFLFELSSSPQTRKRAGRFAKVPPCDPSTLQPFDRLPRGWYSNLKKKIKNFSPCTARWCVLTENVVHPSHFRLTRSNSELHCELIQSQYLLYIKTTNALCSKKKQNLKSQSQPLGLWNCESKVKAIEIWTSLSESSCV